MDINNLVKMANRIGDFFGAWPDREEARKEIAGHLSRFWEPRMRSEIIEHVKRADGEGLEEIVIEAVRQLEPPRGSSSVGP